MHNKMCSEHGSCVQFKQSENEASCKYEQVDALECADVLMRLE